MAGSFPATQGFDRLRIGRQCTATAGHARTLADALDLDPDAACLAGLLLHTGKLLMLMSEPEAIALAERRALRPDALIEPEMALMECTHAEVTAELAQRWPFPQAMVDGLRAAADPMAARPFSKLGAALRLASVISDAGQLGLPPGATLMETLAERVQHLHLHLHLDWLAGHLLPCEMLTAGVDQMLH